MLFASCRQNSTPVSILILDIDHFKKVNDHYGHAAGDEVLRRMAMVLRESVRSVDFLARYGGEEFVVLCPDCDVKAASVIAESIRQRVSELEVGFRNSTIRLTSSVGVAGVVMPYEGPPEDVLEKADQALLSSQSQRSKRRVVLGLGTQPARRLSAPRKCHIADRSTLGRSTQSGYDHNGPGACSPSIRTGC